MGVSAQVDSREGIRVVPVIRHVAGVAEVVEDVNKAIAFYTTVLGLELQSREGDDYAVVAVPGVLHFGIWNRAHAAESVFGSREHAERVPLGFTLELEVDEVDQAAQSIDAAGQPLAQAPRVEPWGQKTCRLLSPGGSLLGFAETPWARRLVKPLETSSEDEPA